MDKRLSKIIDNKKRCTLCEEWVDLSGFGTWWDNKGTWKAKRPYYTARCKPCMSKNVKKWREENSERHKQNSRDWTNKMKSLVYDHYGRVCVCCKESEEMFLTIDHINNDGYLIRPRIGGTRGFTSGNWYKRIVDQGFPTDLQVLCFNCNCGKQRNKGVCPHGGA